MMHKASLLALGIGMSLSSQAEYGTDLNAAPSPAQTQQLQNMHERKLSLDKLNNLAEKGDANAQYRLGLVYREGLGAERCESTAFRWFQQAAVTGHTDASFALGLLYADWEDTDNALHWLDIARERGHEGAEFAYQYMLENDFGYGC